jgi:hypothetical protein
LPEGIGESWKFKKIRLRGMSPFFQ